MAQTVTIYTPGPWQYAFEGGTVAFIVESDGTTVAKLSVTENTTAHAALPANARLIAEAPAMLNALQDIVRVYGPESGPGRVAVAAICKATGGVASDRPSF